MNNITKIIGDIVCIILIIYVIAILGTITIYDKGTYDCSNMCTDQALFFESIGINVDVAVSSIDDTDNHAWLILNILGHDLHWECTGLSPKMNSMKVEYRYTDIHYIME